MFQREGEEGGTITYIPADTIEEGKHLVDKYCQGIDSDINVQVYTVH